MKLKETLNLGKTAFPMRAGLPTKEPVWQKEWEEAKLYQRRQELTVMVNGFSTSPITCTLGLG